MRSEPFRHDGGAGGIYRCRRGANYSPEQIIRTLAEGQKLLAGGTTVEEVCRQFGITESIWARWLNQYGGMKANDAKRLKGLEVKNQRLKQLLAEATGRSYSLRRRADPPQDPGRDGGCATCSGVGPGNRRAADVV